MPSFDGSRPASRVTWATMLHCGKGGSVNQSNQELRHDQYLWSQE